MGYVHFHPRSVLYLPLHSSCLYIIVIMHYCYYYGIVRRQR
jgi:hypothetical protein